MTQLKDNINSHDGKHLTCEERVMIEGYKELGYSNRAIARSLKRAPQTIHNAVKRGTKENQHKLVRRFSPEGKRTKRSSK